MIQRMGGGGPAAHSDNEDNVGEVGRQCAQSVAQIKLCRTLISGETVTANEKQNIMSTDILFKECSRKKE